MLISPTIVNVESLPPEWQERLIVALDAKAAQEQILTTVESVLGQSFGPAGLFVRHALHGDGKGGLGLHVSLEGITQNPSRPDHLLTRLAGMLLNEYILLLDCNIPVGQTVHLFVVVEVDRPVTLKDGSGSGLFEAERVLAMGASGFTEVEAA